jgi:hypothetical protein
MTISFGKTVPAPEGDLNRNVSDRTGVVSGAYRRTRDRVESAAALQRDQQENQPQQTTGTDDWYGRLQRKWAAEKKADEAAKLAEQREREARERTEADRQRVIADRIKFLVESCGFTVERATEHVRGKM